MSKRNWFLLAAAVLLSVYVYFFERAAPVWEAAGKVFKEIGPSDIYEVEISRPADAAEKGLGIAARSVRLRYEGSPAAWWIVEPIHFEAFHPRVTSIVYELADLVRVADVGETAAAFPKGPEISVRFKTRASGDHLVEVGADHPDSSLNFSYCRVAGKVFVTRKEFRQKLTVSLEELRSRALVPVSSSDAVELSVSGGAKFEKTMSRDGDRWRLRKPLDALADRQHVDELLNDLNAWTVASFEKDDAKSPEDMAPYGLVDPRAKVTVRHRDGWGVALEIGGDVPKSGGADTEGFIYVRHAGTPFVFTAARKALDQALETPEYYRSRFVLDLGLDEVTEVRGKGTGGAFLVKRAAADSAKADSSKEESWQIIVEDDKSPWKTFSGDRQVIQGLLTSLRMLLVQKFVGDEVSPESVGLSPPRGKLEIRTAVGRQLELDIGSLAVDPEYKDLKVHHVATPGEPGSFLVAFRWPDVLEKGAKSLWQREISGLDPAALVELELKDGEKEWRLGRTPGDPWGLPTDVPLAPGKELKQALVNQLVSLLSKDGFRVEEYLPELEAFSEHGLDLMAPRRAVVFLSPREIQGFRKIVLGDKVEGTSRPQVRARVDRQNVPCFTLLQEGVPKAFDELAAHLRDITGG